MGVSHFSYMGFQAPYFLGILVSDPAKKESDVVCILHFHKHYMDALSNKWDPSFATVTHVCLVLQCVQNIYLLSLLENRDQNDPNQNMFGLSDSHFGNGSDGNCRNIFATCQCCSAAKSKMRHNDWGLC
jgi:hypothetical protein